MSSYTYPVRSGQAVQLTPQQWAQQQAQQQQRQAQRDQSQSSAAFYPSPQSSPTSSGGPSPPAYQSPVLYQSQPQQQAPPQQYNQPRRQSSSSQTKEPLWFCMYREHQGVAFARKADLKRHYDHVHNSESLQALNCPEGGCHRKGQLGFLRKDKLLDHLREVHKADIPKRGGAGGGAR